MKWLIMSFVLGLLPSGFFLWKFLQLKKHILPTKSNTLLRDILKLSSNKDDVTEASMSIIDSLVKYYKIDYCSLFKVEDHNNLKLLASNVGSSYHQDIEGKVNNTLSNMKHYQANITVSDDYLDYVSATSRKIKYNYFIPLNIDNNIIGAIFIENGNVDDLRVEKEFFSIIIENITIVLQNLLCLQTISNLAMRDGLTGTYNRNFMNNFLSNALRKKNKFCIAIVDIDHFKSFNDTFGHLFGDLTLKIVSNFIESQLRGNDAIFRFGGEEFVMYFENKTEDQAFSLVESIRTGIETLSIEDEKSKTNVKCSFGCYEVRNDSTIAGMIEKADQALYYSKENGRNRTTKYSDLVCENNV